ncbi:polyketide synthase dehydratase domain-containing protein, partial [Streptomyces sp. NPDC004376]
MGQASPDHPLLGSFITLPDADRAVFTGHLSLRSHPWLGDHVVLDTALLPGAAFVEMALRAGDQFGCDVVEELTLEAPLMLPKLGGVQLQVIVEESDERQRRSVAVYARPDDETDFSWHRYASGVLTIEQRHIEAALPTWPPAGATSMDTQEIYEQLSEHGLSYGDSFRGLTAAWRRGKEIFAEVALPEGYEKSAGKFVIHPALLDATMHAGSVELIGHGGGPMLPFTWTGVALHATGATQLRVCLSFEADDRVSIMATDGAGQPVVSVHSMIARRLPAENLRGTSHALTDRLADGALFSLQWTSPIEVPRYESTECVVLGAESSWLVSGLQSAGFNPLCYPDVKALGDAMQSGTPVPDHVFTLAVSASAADTTTDARRSTLAVLETVQAWLAQPTLESARLVVVTRASAQTDTNESLANATAVGLVRSAISENPGRFAVVDIDELDSSWRSLPAAAIVHDEAQLALREGMVKYPRLTALGLPSKQSASKAELQVPVVGGSGTVLITGGTGVLGGLVARHVVGVW